MPKAIPEFHQQGNLTIENILELFDVSPSAEGYAKQCDVGLMTAADGRIWLCVDGIAFIRFSPHPNGRMARDA